MNAISTKKKVFAAVLASALALGVSGSAMAANGEDANQQGMPVAELTASTTSIDLSKLSPEELAEYEKLSKEIISMGDVSFSVAAITMTGDESKDLPDGIVKMGKIAIGEGEVATATTMATTVEN